MDFTNDTGDRILDLVSQLRSMLNQRGQKYSGGSLHIDIPEDLDERTRVAIEFYLNDTPIDNDDKYNPQYDRCPRIDRGYGVSQQKPIRADTTKVRADTTKVTADTMNSVVMSMDTIAKSIVKHLQYA